jgi:hypothetical protein
MQGTGAQNLPNALRTAWADVSGIEFGPNFRKRMSASSLVNPDIPVLGSGIGFMVDLYFYSKMASVDRVYSYLNVFRLRRLNLIWFFFR